MKKHQLLDLSSTERVSLKEINGYDCAITKDDIQEYRHRELVGGLWEQIGLLQYEYLKESGLRPEESLLDVGCGCLRGGLHFIDFLDTGNYVGVDANLSFLEAGLFELKQANLSEREALLVCLDDFQFERLERTFDRALAISLFTHLPAEKIELCLARLASCLKQGSRLYATFFIVPECDKFAEVSHGEAGIITFRDRDPFHYTLSDLQALGQNSGFTLECLEAWNHPRDQQIATYVRV